MPDCNTTLVLLLVIVGTLSFAWIIPGIISLCVVSMGSFKHVIYLDSQLSSNLNNLYDEAGNLKETHFVSIGGRIIAYCFTYPFIRNRAKSISMKYNVFMWLNFVGIWSFMLTLLLAFLVRNLNIISQEKMAMAPYEAALLVFTAIFGGYLIIWAIPGSVMIAMVAFGDIERIVYIDKNLAKDLDKYYDERGYLKTYYQLPSSVGTRLFGYWIAYPFIKKRATTQSKRFKIFMWINCLGMWSFIGETFFVCLGKLLGIIP